MKFVNHKKYDLKLNQLFTDILVERVGDEQDCQEYIDAVGAILEQPVL